MGHVERTLYCHPVAAPARAVMWYMDYLEAPYTKRVVDIEAGETQQEAFRKKNPLGLVPVLEEEDDFCLSESSAILQYLQPDPVEPTNDSLVAADSAIVRADTQPQHAATPPPSPPPAFNGAGAVTSPTSPADSPGRTAGPPDKLMVHVEEYIGNHHSTVARLSSEALIPILSASSAEGRTGVIKAVGENEEVTRVLKRWNAELGVRKYVAGEALTLADFLFACEVDQLHIYGLLHSYPSIRKHLRNMQGVKGYSKCFRELIDYLAERNLVVRETIRPF